MPNFFESLADTPLPTLFILIGLLMVSIGFGLTFKTVIDVERLNPIFAKIAGICLLVLGLISNLDIIFPKVELRDPFIGYYLICVPIVVIACWMMLKYTHDQIQLLLIKRAFAFIGALVTITVFWRAMNVYFYLKGPNINNVPLGLYYEQSNFLPYFILLGLGILLVAWIVFHYTREEPDNANRLPIFGYFGVFCIYLVFCRLGWEIVGYVATVKLPTSPT